MSQNKICWFDVNGSQCTCPKCFGCRRKKGYIQHEAQEVAGILNAKPNRRQARVKAYDCPWCDDWHVGHDNKLVPLWKQKNRRK